MVALCSFRDFVLIDHHSYQTVVVDTRSYKLAVTLDQGASWTKCWHAPQLVA
jgi:hypothetical protein